MGDRCQLNLWYPKLKAPEVAVAFGQPGYDIHPEDNDWEQSMFEEVNYGGTREREELDTRRVPYYGMHYSGDAYGPILFASFEGVQHEQDADEDGFAIMRIPKNSRDIDSAVTTYLTYLRTLDQLRTHCGAPIEEDTDD